MADTQITVRLDDQTGPGTRSVNSNLDSIQGNMKNTGTTASGIANDIIRLGTAIATSFVVKELVQTAAEFETLRATLGAVTKDVKVGNAVFEELKDIATNTVFGVKDLTEAYIKLSAAGIPPTTKQLNLFNDIASVSADKIGTLQAITDLYARTVGGGLGLEELNRLADRGIPVYKMLSDAIGVNRESISKLGTTAEGAKLILQALEGQLQKDYGGSAAKQSGTLSMAFSQLKDAASNLADDIGRAGLNAALTETANLITNLLKSNPELIKQIGQGLGDAVRFLTENFDKLILVAQAFFLIMTVRTILAVAAAFATLELSVVGLSVAFNRIPLAALITLLGIAGIAIYDYAKGTDKATTSTNTNSNATNDNADANKNQKSAIDAAAEAARQKEIQTRKETFVNKELSEQLDIIKGKTDFLTGSNQEGAKAAADLLRKNGDNLTMYGKYAEQLEVNIRLADEDSVAKRIQAETTKALEAAQKSAVEQNLTLSESLKELIKTETKAAIIDDETKKAKILALKNLDAANLANLDATEQYLQTKTYYEKDYNKRTIKDADTTAYELETIRLNFINKDLQMQRDATASLKTDQQQFDHDRKIAVKKFNEGLYSNEEELNSQLRALQINYVKQYKDIDTKAKELLLDDTDKYSKAILKLDDDLKMRRLTSENDYVIAKQAINDTYNKKYVDQAKAFRIEEGGAEAKFNEELKALQKAKNAGLIQDQQVYNDNYAKLRRDLISSTVSEYSTLYSTLESKLLEFVGINSSKWPLIKDVIKLFGVDSDKILKDLFTSAIYYVKGLFAPQATTSIGEVGSAISKVFSNDSPGIIKTFIDGAISLFSNFGSTVSSIFSGIGSFISNLFGGGSSILTTALSAITSFASSAGSAVSSVVSTVASAIGIGGAAAAAGGGAAAAGGGAAAIAGGGAAAAAGGGAAAAGGGAAAIAGGSSLLAVGGALLTGAAVVYGFGKLAEAIFGEDAFKSYEQLQKENTAKQQAFDNQKKNEQQIITKLINDLKGKYSLSTDVQGNLRLQDRSDPKFGKYNPATNDYDLAANLLQGRTIKPNLYTNPTFYQEVFNEYKNRAGSPYSDFAFGPSNYIEHPQDAMLLYLATGSTKYGAKGLAYNMGNLISAPTAYGTRSGIAIGGEMGTEAIMPLKRGPDGRLGVSSDGSSGVNINFTINAVDARGIDQLLVERQTLITNIVRRAVNSRSGVTI